MQRILKMACPRLFYVILLLAFLGIENLVSQTDTLHLNYSYSQVALHDSAIAKIDKWLAELNGKQVNANLVAYYSRSEFKQTAQQRVDELFLLLNRKARAQISIDESKPKRGKESQRSMADIVYKYTPVASALAIKTVDTVTTKTSDSTALTNAKKKQTTARDTHTVSKKGTYVAAFSFETYSNDWKMKNIIKLNAIQLLAYNLALQYECAFHKNVSAALGFSYLLSRSMPSFLYPSSKSTTGAVIGLFKPNFSGYSITPEIRFYPLNTKKGAPQGFYLSPYFRYSKYNINADYGFWINGTLSSFAYTMSYQGGTGGIMLGSQWLLGKHISLDWWIVGGGVGKAKAVGQAHSGSVNLTVDEQALAAKQLSDDLSSFSLTGAKEPAVETSPNSLKVTAKELPMFSLRGLGFCLGFVF